MAEVQERHRLKANELLSKNEALCDRLAQALASAEERSRVSDDAAFVAVDALAQVIAAGADKVPHIQATVYDVYTAYLRGVRSTLEALGSGDASHVCCEVREREVFVSNVAFAFDVAPGDKPTLDALPAVDVDEPSVGDGATEAKPRKARAK